MKVHEISPARVIVDIARNEFMRHHADRIESVRVRIGPRAVATRGALVSSYEVASEGTLVEGSRLVFERGRGRELHVVAVELVKGKKRIQEPFISIEAA